MRKEASMGTDMGLAWLIRCQQKKQSLERQKAKKRKARLKPHERICYMTTAFLLMMMLAMCLSQELRLRNLQRFIRDSQVFREQAMAEIGSWKYDDLIVMACRKEGG